MHGLQLEHLFMHEGGLDPRTFLFNSKLPLLDSEDANPAVEREQSIWNRRTGKGNGEEASVLLPYLSWRIRMWGRRRWAPPRWAWPFSRQLCCYGGKRDRVARRRSCGAFFLAVLLPSLNEWSQDKKGWLHRYHSTVPSTTALMQVPGNEKTTATYLER